MTLLGPVPGPSAARAGRPEVVGTRAELATALAATRTAGAPVVLVPTMGALHAGHASLVEHARSRAGDRGAVVVSVFVNPLQFAPTEDLDRYPRTFEADLGLCARHGADLVFAPSASEVYPGGDPRVSVDAGPLGSVLEGEVRPGHFRGVLTVVAKLFGLVRPDIAVFGEKDYQQLVLVRQLAEDLCLGVEVAGAPTVRDDDGLALSSRNAHLDPGQRRTALVLVRALRAGVAAGGSGAAAVLAAARGVLGSEDDVEVDYCALTSPGLSEASTEGAARLLVAARVGSTRLIDNVEVQLGSARGDRGASRR